jgi:RNA polymerase sigma-70 factor (ECF subfamily)
MNPCVEDRLLATFNDLRNCLASTLIHLLGNYADAQDVLQGAFVKCWEARAELVAVVNLRAWIWRVAINAAKDLQRSAWRLRRRSLYTLYEVQTCQHVSPPDVAAHREQARRLWTALQELGAAQREVFLLRQNGALTYEEIAELQQKPVGTVKTQMHAAVQKLRSALQDREPAIGAAVGRSPRTARS